MTYDPKNTADPPGADSPHGRQSRVFVVLIALVALVLIGVVVSFALRSSAFNGTHRPVNSTPVSSPGATSQ